MIRVNFANSVTVSKDLSGGFSEIQSYKYNQFNEVANDLNEIEVDYYYGQRNKRVKLLTELGFKLKETKWFNDSAPSDMIKQIWAK